MDPTADALGLASPLAPPLPRSLLEVLDQSIANGTQSGPLNRAGSFVPWQHFNPGNWIDTNPGFVWLDPDHAWAVFTRYAVPPQPGAGSIWAVRVDASMQPITLPIPIIGHGIDPRVVRLGERIFVFYIIIERDGEGGVNGSFVALSEFVVMGDRWTEVESLRLPRRPVEREPAEGDLPNWEKNWVPFAINDRFVTNDRSDDHPSDDQPFGDPSSGDPAGSRRSRGHSLGLIYSHDPWDVITLTIGRGIPRRFDSLHSSPGIQWDYGLIRGGTPPVRYDEAHWLTFFHSSQVMASRNVYSVGACVFLAQPPFNPVRMTTEPLLIAPYRSGAERFGWQFAGSVVFPLGAERTEHGYRLLCGRDDGEIASFLVPQDELAARLGPLRHGPSGTVHDYRGGRGARLPTKALLYVPDPIPAIPELPMINFLRAVAGRGRTFVDVGSHIGFYTMGLAPGFERVIAFEPSRLQYGWLRRNAALNAYDHVVCEHVALGGAAGTATLNVLSYEGGLNSLSPEVARGHTILGQYTVLVEALDDRCLTDVDLLKIDVEGFEIPVLRGAVRTIAASRPVILIEVWEDVVRRRDVQAVMTDMEYSMEFLFPRSPELAICLPRERRNEYAWFI